ncbi:GNAT family N-acetyltransferase [Alteribacillus sp. HJP-4]|uniref:GNAT family N-acetyltransferase n=1 Tax=Alteribacillus sp. HJP-4 TaxID=2775394 RepID=UPI0035CD009C
MTTPYETIGQDVTIRPVTKEDIPAIYEVAVIGFGKDIAFEPKHYESQIEKFPDGQRCVEYDGRIIGASGSLRVSEDQFQVPHKLSDICDNGYIRNHDDSAPHLYGIEVVVHPDYRHLKVGQKLYEERKQLARDLQVKSILIGGRIPNYHKYQNELTPEQYAEKVIEGELYDPVMTFQLKSGFSFRRILNNYIPEDNESCTNASLMEWINDEYSP